MTKNDMIDQLRDALTNGVVTQADVLTVLSEIGEQDPDPGPHIEIAREEYVTDDVEIDDLPLLSRGDSGYWVSAWVWVYDPEVVE